MTAKLSFIKGTQFFMNIIFVDTGIIQIWDSHV